MGQELRDFNRNYLSYLYDSVLALTPSVEDLNKFTFSIPHS